MKSCLFACDIDNTLIYSRKKPHTGFRCVEWIHDEEQAYMSPGTEAGLRRILSACLFVPVTSRSVEQYRRIRLPEPCTPGWAVTANGADLLHCGTADPDWREETDRLIAGEVPELLRMEELLRDDGRFIRCRVVDGAYLFVYCGSGVSPSETAAGLAEQTRLCVTASGKKVYLMPRALNKAFALERLSRRFGIRTVISAGDSEMDLPMLEKADLALMPEELLGSWHGSGKALVPRPGTLFSDFVLSEGLAWLEE